MTTTSNTASTIPDDASTHLHEYGPGQWWLDELRKHWSPGESTLETRRAAHVALGFAGKVFGLREILSSCSPAEVAAFEAWAAGNEYDMTTHPLHWLFLNERTYAARQGWKAALRFASTCAGSAPAPAAQTPSRDAETVLQRLNGLCDRLHDTFMAAEAELFKFPLAPLHESTVEHNRAKGQHIALEQQYLDAAKVRRRLLRAMKEAEDFMLKARKDGGNV